MSKPVWHCECHHTPCDGLECGVFLPGRAPRRKPAAKSPDELSAIRAKAWATRRAKQHTPPAQTENAA